MFILLTLRKPSQLQTDLVSPAHLCTLKDGPEFRTDGVQLMDLLSTMEGDCVLLSGREVADRIFISFGSSCRKLIRLLLSSIRLYRAVILCLSFLLVPLLCAIDELRLGMGNRGPSPVMMSVLGGILFDRVSSRTALSYHDWGDLLQH